MDYRIELTPLNVSDVDRAVEFYGTQLGWPVDFNQTVNDGVRFVQVTPPGSACSICFGTGIDMMMPGGSQYLQVVVADADEAFQDLRDRGVECTEVQDLAWGRFVNFTDPDGNRWAVQQMPAR